MQPVSCSKKARVIDPCFTSPSSSYYALLICKLCETKQSHRFSLKIAFYDFFKALQVALLTILPALFSFKLSVNVSFHASSNAS